MEPKGHAMNPATELISLEEASNILGCSTKTVRRRIAEGKLTGYRMGPRFIRLRRSEVEQLLIPMHFGGDAA